MTLISSAIGDLCSPLAVIANDTRYSS